MPLTDADIAAANRMLHEERRHDYSAVIDAIQASNLEYGTKIAQLAAIVNGLSEAVHDHQAAIRDDIKELHGRVTNHPFTCPVKPELTKALCDHAEQIKEHTAQITAIQVFNGRIVGSVAGWAAAVSIAGYFAAKWIASLFHAPQAGG